MRRTARKKLQSACRQIKQWVKLNRHLEAREFVAGLNRRLLGHYNYYGLRGNSRSLWCFYHWAIGCSFKWLNRRGGKRRSFMWEAFGKALMRVGVARPRITERKRQHAVFAQDNRSRECEYNRGTGCVMWRRALNRLFRLDASPPGRHIT